MSLPWTVVERHANSRVEALRTALETAQADRILSLQGELRAWRELLRLPETLPNTPDKHLEPERSGYA